MSERLGTLSAMLASSRVLVEVVFGTTHVGVREDSDGCAWLAHWRARSATRVAGSKLLGTDAGRFYADGWVAVGGRLDERAGHAEIRLADGTWRRAVAGAGAWVAVLDEADFGPGPPVVRVAARSGGAWVVPCAPRGDGTARRLTEEELHVVAPVLGWADARCPVCGSTEAAWQGPGVPPASSENVRCSHCGHAGRAVPYARA
jgi:hypothetical protein